MSITPQGESPQLSSSEPVRRRRRWILWTAIAASPFLLFYLPFMLAEWRNDYRVAGLRDQVLQHPLPPPGIGFAYNPQVETDGDSGDCTVDIGLDVYTDRSVEETLKHYRAAGFANEGGAFHFFDIDSHDEPDPSAEGEKLPTENPGYRSLTIYVGAEYSGFFDPRCW